MYTSLDWIVPEVEINHPHNSGVINIYLRNWRHYEELQKHQEGDNYVKFSTMEDLKSSNDNNDVIIVY